MTSKRGRQNGGGPRRSDVGRYALVGIITCQHCGRRMQGNHSRGHAFYRCRLTAGDYAAPPDGHPRSLAIREDRILRVLDQWLVDLFAPDRITQVAAQIVDADRLNHREHQEVQAARHTIADARRKIDRYVDGLEAGMDPGLVAERTRAAQADIAIAQALLDSTRDTPTALTIDEVTEILDAVRTLPELLTEADIELRADVYRSLGLQLTYRREGNAEYVQVLASITSVDLMRVEGSSRTMSTWPAMRCDLDLAVS